MLMVSSQFVIFYILCCCRWIANGAVVKSSLTSIGTRLSVQDESSRTTKNCNDACAAIGLSCNFDGIHLIPLSEMKTKIKEMLPNQVCYSTDDSSTLVNDNYKYHKYKHDPLLNVENQCSSGFEKIGYYYEYPVCETKGTSDHRRICQCGDNNVTDSFTSIGSKLVAQVFRTGAVKSCSDTCSEAGMTCDFSNFDKIPLDELKIKIQNELPREKCKGIYADVIVTDNWKDYKSAFDPSLNKDNLCVAGYMGMSATKFPKCNEKGTTQSIRICQCTVLQSSITSIGTKLVVQYPTKLATRNCNDACQAIGLPCNFANIHLMNIAEVVYRIKQMLPNKVCDASIDQSTIVSNNYKYHKYKLDPQFYIINKCSTGFEKIGYSYPYPVCETTGTNERRRICQCGNNNVTDSDISIGSKLVAQNFLTGKDQTCDDTCNAGGMVCDFSNFDTIGMAEIKSKIKNLLPREYCNGINANADVIVTDNWKNYKSAFDPSFNKDNFCVAGYMGMSETKFPKCNVKGTSQSIRICQCTVPKSSVTSIGTKLVVQYENNRATRNCNDACQTIGLPCNFANIHLMSAAEMKHTIKKMLPKQVCNASDDGSTIVNNNNKNHKHGQDPMFNVNNFCTSGFEKIGYSYPYPVCETTGTDVGRRICQCGNNNVTDSDTSIGSRLVAQNFSSGASDSCNDTCNAAGMDCDFSNFDTIPLEELKIKIQNVLPREQCTIVYTNVIVTDSWQNYNNAFDPSFNKDNFCVAGYMGMSAATNFPKCNATGTTQSIRICQCFEPAAFTTVVATPTYPATDETTNSTVTSLNGTMNSSPSVTNQTTTSEDTSEASTGTSSNSAISGSSSNAN